MRLAEFTFLSTENRDKALRYLAKLVGHPEGDLTELNELVEAAFTASRANNQITYSEADGETYAEFPTGLTTTAGEEIMGRCLLNTKPGSLQRWFGLLFVVRREGFVIGDLCFETASEGTRFLKELADLAIPETWTYQQYQSKVSHPILRSLIQHTLARLQQQGKVLVQGGRALFNTSLIDRFFKEIYVVADYDPQTRRLTHAQPVLESDRIVLEQFGGQRPELATFFEQINDVVFDPSLPISTNDIHIIEENFERIPAEYRQLRLSQLFALFQASVEFSRIMAARNYKLIVPQFYHDQIQFLMPIYLSGEFGGSPDFSLVLERIGDCYRGNTILTLDMAYQNARLIARLESTWLTAAVSNPTA